MSNTLPPSYMRDIEQGMHDAWQIAVDLGLDPYPTNFEILPAAMIYEIAGYGMPSRFTHWSHGKQYARHKLHYDYGLSKIYELVINTNPCQAFLLDTNTALANKFVIAHVLGHSDFFKNNAWFSKTNRSMTDEMGSNASRIRNYEYEHGMREVEKLLDAVLSIDLHVDDRVSIEDTYSEAEYHPNKLQSDYDDLWHDPDEPGHIRWTPAYQHRPREPIEDLLLFIAEHAPNLEDWQRDVILMLRRESLYFQPQVKTKIANEGWATWAHTRIMREMPLSSDEHIEFARLHSSVVNPGGASINPYYLGFMILEDIERRFGTEYLFTVRETENDISLIRNYLTEDLTHDLDLFVYERFGTDLIATEKDWEKVRDGLINQLTTMTPRIAVVDGDYQGNRELYLRHCWDGLPLDMPYAEKTLEYVYQLWGRRVWLETRDSDGAKKILTMNKLGISDHSGFTNDSDIATMS